MFKCCSVVFFWGPCTAVTGASPERGHSYRREITQNLNSYPMETEDCPGLVTLQIKINQHSNAAAVPV